MKVRIDIAEGYPVYVIEEGRDYGGMKLSVDRRKVKRWKGILKEYYKVQDEIEKAWVKEVKLR